MRTIAQRVVVMQAGRIAEGTAAGLAIWAWTVNDPNRLDELFATPAVTGVITDHPVAAMTRREAMNGGAVSNGSSA